MKVIQLLAFLCLLPSARAGDSVNNGGGLAEQASVYAAQHFSSFAESCMLYSSCTPTERSRGVTRDLIACRRPLASDLRFAVPGEKPLFAEGQRYAQDTAGAFIVNREYLYVKGEPMRLPAALGYLARLFLDHCQILSYAESASFAAAFSALADQSGEQITVGKENLNLPAREWIRVRTLNSDLLIESPKYLSRVSCSDSLRECSLTKELSNSKFRNLSLRGERQRSDGAVVFELEGIFGTWTSKKLFNLVATYRSGELQQLTVNGISLEIPTRD